MELLIKLPERGDTLSGVEDFRFKMIDHISLVTCCGAKNTFFEAKKTPSHFRIEQVRVYIIYYQKIFE